MNTCFWIAGTVTGFLAVAGIVRLINAARQSRREEQMEQYLNDEGKTSCGPFDGITEDERARDRALDKADQENKYRKENP